MKLPRWLASLGGGRAPAAGEARPGAAPSSSQASQTAAEVDQQLDARAEEALLLRLLPWRPGPLAKRSRFGGLPELPPGYPWPTLEPAAAGTPAPGAGAGTLAMSFLAQIDLGELPAFARRERLPAAGTLLFFADTDPELSEPDDAKRVRVLHAPPGAWPERPPPANAMAMGRHMSETPWLRGRAAAVAPPRAVEFVPFTSYPDDPGEPSPWDLGDAWHEAYWRKQLQSLSAALGRPEPGAESQSALTAPTDDEAYPYVGTFVEHPARGLAARLRFLLRFYRYHEGSFSLEPATRSLFLAVRREAVEWRLRMRGRRFEPVAEGERAAFRAWLDDVRTRLALPSGAKDADKFARWELEKLEAAAFTYAVAQCATRSESACGGLPIRYRQGDGASSSPSPMHMTRHQMLGYGKSVQSAPIEHRGELLLLQIDNGLFFGDSFGCVFQVWIAEADARAGRWEAAVATFECD